MTGYRQTLLVLLLTILSGVAVAQNNTNSPYTRYGYGQLSEQGSSNSRAMGGIAYGLRDKYQTNFANPASYTAVDSLTFIFDGAVSLQNTNLSTPGMVCVSWQWPIVRYAETMKRFLNRFVNILLKM